MTNQTEKEPVEQEIVEETVEQAVETEQENANVEIDPLDAANARIAELEAYIAEADAREQDIALRARAEIENVRRRAEQDVEKAHKFALEKFSKELLNVVDNLERGLQALEGAEESVKSGVELTHKGLVSTLAQFGVEAVGVVGEAFNPDLHQAISMQPAEGIEANHISVVLQKGYTLQGRVIRPAMVMVAG
ncbi:Protein grpE [Bibersteinia trehalosi USDA-ARS-USMARC-188]|uniref:Protein GrpE n=3 Tax=Bibersteinia trehalosi TaxID=47735 RepID=A0A4V7IAK4_BIBTR|nr:nucleotide exchange factor GrpE [Bibersteinia trehalosi]AGH38165.1 Protein grpE [Bibersteinia trehalosi USDA-ARS-USMARC-192]AHG82034.1 Protein grpE [Bibersteinia trehalosi USDA-ARS-USMARC-188]AHG84342.1 Protein grpE [Bibersteinia trehalosi USDA-ARS-USMARC-189]OAQ15315.1 molecular chaperone GrpE [Bibersteinia trehalosi Y31]TCT18374.1 molecular chaperone GrpE [Bibersteinia trehalosi]